MDAITIISLVLAVGYLGYVIFEKIYYTKIRKTFKYVIHVNGIRGKSTTTRLIDAGMRNCGYKVFSKTTGTIPTMINTNNELIEIKRIGQANIREQLKIMRKAYKEKAEVLVIECMAINPELQYICEHRMLHSDCTLITNVRMDHIGDMGDNLDELALALANTIPDKGHLIINDNKYYDLYQDVICNRDVKIHIATPYTLEDDLGTFKDNIAIALEVSNVFGLDKDRFFMGMQKYHHDQGAYKVFQLGQTIFMNAFSANDPESIKLVYEKYTKEFNPEEITILLNTRDDRPTRTIQHIEMLKLLKYKKIIIIGASTFYIKKKLKEQAGLVIEPLNFIDFKRSIAILKSEKYIFATGNIGGLGMKILKYFEENGERYDS